FSPACSGALGSPAAQSRNRTRANDSFVVHRREPADGASRTSRHVRSTSSLREQSGRDILRLSFSEFDPERTCRSDRPLWSNVPIDLDLIRKEALTQRKWKETQ